MRFFSPLTLTALTLFTSATAFADPSGRSNTVWALDQVVGKQLEIPSLDAIGSFLAHAGEDISRFAEHEIMLAQERFEDLKIHLQQFERTIEQAAQTIGRISDSAAKGDTEKLHEELNQVLETTLQELQTMFPPPETARGHEERKADVKRVLDAVFDKAGEAVVKHLQVPEKDVREVFGAVRDALETVIVFVGDAAEQHPVIFRAVVALISAQLGRAILPPAIRVLLNALGFGALGPEAGSAAAWAQRMFFGAYVPKGSVFGVLQAAGQTGKLPEWVDAVGAVVGGITGLKLSSKL